MPGLASGLLEGIDVGSGIALRARALQQDQARLNLEKTRQDTELARQQHLDTITALQAQRDMIGNSAAPHIAYLSHPPVDPTQDPDGYKAWTDSDEYKSHATQAQNIAQQAQDITGKLNGAYGDLAGAHWQQVKSQAKQDAASVTAGVTDPTTLSPGRLAGLVQSSSDLPPEQFVIDPKTGQMPAQVAMDTFHNALHTGDWSQTAPAMTLLLHRAQTAIGQKLGGGTVSGVQLGPPVPDKDDPNQLNVPQVYQIHRPDGTVAVVRPPPLRASRAEIMQRAANLDQHVRGLQHPELQKNLQQAVAQGDTPYGQLTSALAAAGVPQSAYLPAHEYKEVPAFGSLADVTPGQQPHVVVQGTVKPMGGLEGLVQQEMAAHPGEGPDQALERVQSTYQDRKAPPADGGAAAGALLDARRQHAADLAYRGAVLQLAREKGYKVDKDGNLMQGSDDPNGEFKRGDAAKDADLEDTFAALRQAADEAAQAGKPLTASQLLAQARQRKPAAATNDDLVTGPAKLANGQEIPPGTTVTDKHGNRMQYSGGGKWKRLSAATPAGASANPSGRSNASPVP